MLRWDETDGSVSVFRQPSGNAVDGQGRLLTCEHRTRSVTRTEHDGSRTAVADRWSGRRLNFPNDVAVAADEAVWFTDPDYGIFADCEDARAESEICACHLYRADPRTGAADAVATDFVKPNGLAVSGDRGSFYVADSGASHVSGGPRHISRFAAALSLP